jgi:hypothetical protein
MGFLSANLIALFNLILGLFVFPSLSTFKTKAYLLTFQIALFLLQLYCMLM